VLLYSYNNKNNDWPGVTLDYIEMGALEGGGRGRGRSIGSIGALEEPWLRGVKASSTTY